MVYILLPVYNEESHIKNLLENITSVMSGLSFKVIVVDDGSSDQTEPIVRNMNLDNVVILRHNINLSIGAVYSTGINYILHEANEEDVLVLMEADLTSPAEIVLTLRNELLEKDRDLVIGSRFLKTGGYKNFPVQRSVLSLGANALMRILFPIEGVSDYTIFVRAYRVTLLKKVFEFFGPYNCLQSKGFVSNVELLVKCSLFTQKISEVPFLYNYGLKKNRSKLGVLRTLLEYFSFIFYMRLIVQKVRSRKPPITDT
ncbi:MAG: glycosyltransferase [Nitrospinae bacterium]|nr:glycosyltransferase [Nitrospinota bacterium]